MMPVISFDTWTHLPASTNVRKYVRVQYYVRTYAYVLYKDKQFFL